jgi:hypothetical protein
MTSEKFWRVDINASGEREPRSPNSASMDLRTFAAAADQTVPSVRMNLTRSHPADRVRKIVFVKRLIEKLQKGEITVTYRTSPKSGRYRPSTSRFKSGEVSELIIEFYKSEIVNPYDLRDEDAQKAGIETANELRTLLSGWYGDPIPKIFRNWFRIVQQ